jgi:hypothetical protein
VPGISFGRDVRRSPSSENKPSPAYFLLVDDGTVQTSTILTMRARTGTAQLPLHGGRAPAWLFSRMVQLAREITIHIVSEYGSEEMLRRLSDPFWFQAFGCVLGFDWHSSGVTTTVTGALKEGLKGLERDLRLYAGGGKGAVSRRTPAEITLACERLSIDPRPLVYASRISAKVDSAAVQDGYQLYHHAFFFTPSGAWCVVQQGMSHTQRSAPKRAHRRSTSSRARASRCATRQRSCHARSRGLCSPRFETYRSCRCHGGTRS